jgi:hypothetical protein
MGELWRGNGKLERHRDLTAGICGMLRYIRSIVDAKQKTLAQYTWYTMKHKMPIQLQMWGNTGHDQTKFYQTKPSGRATKIPKPKTNGNIYSWLARPRRFLAAGDAAQDTRLAQEPQRSNEAENRQTGGRP